MLSRKIILALGAVVVASLLLLTVCLIVNAQNEWCKLENGLDCKKGEHTMCIYQRTGPAAACLTHGNMGGGLTNVEKRRIVELHNQIRQFVASGQETRGAPGPQPPTKTGTMPDLQWDDAIAEIAQRWADQCIYKHDRCRYVVPAHSVGQNLAAYIDGQPGNSSSVDAMVDSWYIEVERYDKNRVRKFDNMYDDQGRYIAHYTQVVWAKTTKIGCGARWYHGGGYKRRNLVCNFGPHGNVLGEPVYET